MSHNRKLRGALLGVALTALTFSTGCVSAKRVTASTANNDSVKFVYVQKSLFRTDQGIIKCDADAQGKLSNCREMTVSFEGEE